MASLTTRNSAIMPFKICCIQSTEEADMAIAAGALAIGLVGAMPSGPGPIDDDAIRAIAFHVRSNHGDKVWTTLLTSRIDGEAIADHVTATGVNSVQIVDAVDTGVYKTIRGLHPHLRIIQVIHVEDMRAVEEAVAASRHADVILLDSGKPSARIRTLGGTGDTHDWSISQAVVEAVEKPVFLAGGLNPDNVAEAVCAVQPYGVDICSGLRDKAKGYALDAGKVSAFAGALSTG